MTVDCPPTPADATPPPASPTPPPSNPRRMPRQPTFETPSMTTDDAPPQRVAQPEVIDHEVLDELRAMLGGEVDRLIDVFLEDTPRLIARSRTPRAAPDCTGLRDAAHSLKSSSANLGAMALSAAAKRIELGARSEYAGTPRGRGGAGRQRIPARAQCARRQRSEAVRLNRGAEARASSTDPALRQSLSPSILVCR